MGSTPLLVTNRVQRATIFMSHLVRKPFRSKIEATTSPNITPTVSTTLTSSDEQQLEGAPEGELYQVTILSRDSFQPYDSRKQLEQEKNNLQEILESKRLQAQIESSNAVEEVNLEDDRISTRQTRSWFPTKSLTSYFHLCQQQPKVCITPTPISWAMEYNAIDIIRCLSIHHKESCEPFLHDAMYYLICPSMKNLRSVVVRNALLCIQDLVLSFKSDLAPYYDEFLPLICSRISHDSRFIRDLAQTVLKTITSECASVNLLIVFFRVGMEDNNPQVISAVGIYSYSCMIELDKTALESVTTTNEFQFLNVLATLLNCKVVDCKKATRKSLQHTRKVLGDKQFLNLVRSSTTLSSVQRDEIIEASKTMKKASKAAGKKLSFRERVLQQQESKVSKKLDEFSASSTSSPTIEAQAISS